MTNDILNSSFTCIGDTPINKTMLPSFNWVKANPSHVEQDMQQRLQRLFTSQPQQAVPNQGLVTQEN